VVVVPSSTHAAPKAAPAWLSESFLNLTGKLRRGADFQRAFSQGVSRSGRHLRLLAVPNHLNEARLGLSIGRRASARAVGRNYMKRVCRQLFRQHARLLMGFDLVVSVKLPFQPGMFQIISAEFETLVSSLQK
jgi:ribonuclease P protein component